MLEIRTENGKLFVKSPYHPEFPTKARNLGGRWDPNARQWVFDPRDERGVRDALREVYGTDGTPTPLVALRLALGKNPKCAEGSTIWAAGRKVASRPGRDTPVRLGSGVVLVQGEFPPVGGSRRYPSIGDAADLADVVLEVRDVPLSLAQAEVAKGWGTVVDPDSSDPKRQALEAEAERLRLRLAEIEAELAGLGKEK